MIEVSKRHFTRTVEEVNDLHYICNKCGVRRRKMLLDAKGKQYAATDPGIPRELDDENTEAEAFVHVSRTGGWADRAFGDGVKIEFDLCQDCLLELVKSFVVPAEAKETMWMGPYAGDVEVGEARPFIDTAEAQVEGALEFYAEWVTWGEEGEEDLR
jgi:hypothetical protein